MIRGLGRTRNMEDLNREAIKRGLLFSDPFCLDVMTPEDLVRALKEIYLETVLARTKNRPASENRKKC